VGLTQNALLPLAPASSPRSPTCATAPHRVIATDDRAAFLVEVTGTHTEALGFPDGSSLPPTGRSIRVELAEFWNFEGQGRGVQGDLRPGRLPCPVGCGCRFL